MRAPRGYPRARAPRGNPRAGALRETLQFDRFIHVCKCLLIRVLTTPVDLLTYIRVIVWYVNLKHHTNFEYPFNCLVIRVLTTPFIRAIVWLVKKSQQVCGHRGGTRVRGHRTGTRANSRDVCLNDHTI